MVDTPSPVTSLDLCSLVAVVFDDDGDLVVLLHDGTPAGAVQFEPGSGGGGGWAQLSAFGAERAASALLRYAAETRERAGLPPAQPVQPYAGPITHVRGGIASKFG